MASMEHNKPNDSSNAVIDSSVGDSIYKKDAEMIYMAMKPKDKDKATIMKVLCQRSNDERQLIKEEYARMYSIKLEDVITKELKGEILEAVQGLLDNPIDYDCRGIFKAIDGAGTDDVALNDIICVRPNAIMNSINQRYPQLYKETLKEALASDTSGCYEKVALILIEGKRSTSQEPDLNSCEKLANELYLQGEKKNGTNEDLFINTFTLKSEAELAAIEFYYKRITGHSLLQAIDGEFTGDEFLVFNTLFHSSLSQTKYYTNRIYTALNDNKTSHIIRLLISRRELDLAKIIEMYKTDYKRDIREDIEKKTKNDAKMILLELINLLK